MVTSLEISIFIITLILLIINFIINRFRLIDSQYNIIKLLKTQTEITKLLLIIVFKVREEDYLREKALGRLQSTND